MCAFEHILINSLLTPSARENTKSPRKRAFIQITSSLFFSSPPHSSNCLPIAPFCCLIGQVANAASTPIWKFHCMYEKAWQTTTNDVMSIVTESTISTTLSCLKLHSCSREFRTMHIFLEVGLTLKKCKLIYLDRLCMYVFWYWLFRKVRQFYSVFLHFFKFSETV